MNFEFVIKVSVNVKSKHLSLRLKVVSKHKILIANTVNNK